MAEREVLVLRQDMTISRDEFLRSLPAAVGQVAYAVVGPEITFAREGRRWRISVLTLPGLVLGMLRLPRQRVSIYLAGYDATAAREFLDRFELYFRRAGG